MHDSLNSFKNIHGLRCKKTKSVKCKIIHTISYIFCEDLLNLVPRDFVMAQFILL
jgi:hypothetical protein